MKKIIIFDFNRTIYDPEPRELIRGAREVLAGAVKQGFTLYLLAQAVAGRRGLVKELGLEQYFSEIILCEEKTLGHFTRLLEREPVDMASSFVIGDRVKKEIRFGNQCGLQTIWLRAGRFMTEMPIGPAETPTYIVEELVDVLPIISATSLA